jgi:hypothetical protein
MVKLHRTKSGRLACWEQGGGHINTGYATIVAGLNGERLRPVYIRRRGTLANSDHALVPIGDGCYVIQAEHHRGDFVVHVYRVAADGVVTSVASFSEGEWQGDRPEFLEAAIEAACWKALCYHCKEPHYVL